jgi:hypothetical protein
MSEEILSRGEDVVKLQHAKCPGATVIAPGLHQGVSLMRDESIILRVCRHCGRDVHTRTRYCSRSCRAEGRLRDTCIGVLLSPDESIATVPLFARSGALRAYAVIDGDDLEWVSQWRWYLNSCGYAARSEQRSSDAPRTILLHREMLGIARGDRLREGDHRNRDRLDNRRGNLRVIPRGSQSQNVPSYKGSSSQYRGVSWDKDAGKWRAYIRTHGKLKHLGLFVSETEAAEVARIARAQSLLYAVD